MNKIISKENQSARNFGLPDITKTVLDIAVFNVCLLLLGLTAIPAHLVSATVALGFSLAVNKRLVYGPSLKRRFSQVLLLLMITVFGVYILQTAVIYLFVDIWQAPLEAVYAAITRLGLERLLGAEFVFANGAKLAAIALSAGSNYVLYRNFNFSNQHLEVVDKIGDWLAGHKDLVILVGILSLATIARLWQLHTLPPGLDAEEAANGLHALSIINGDLRLFYEGQGGLFLYLQALSVSIVGNTALALRLVPALIGIASVLAVFLAAKEWFSTRVGLLAAFFMAISPWALQINRAGYSASLLMFMLPLLMLAVARAVKTNAARWWVATGILLGLGFYSHLSYYAIIPVILVMLVFVRYRYDQHLKRLKQPLTIVLLSLSLTLIPMALQAVIGPDVLFDRGAELGILEATADSGEWIGMAAGALVRTAGMFYVAGDEDFRHNLGGEPQLNIFIGVLLILGVLLVIKRRRDIRYFALLIGLAIFTLPAALAGAHAPDAMLAAGAIPFVYILAAIGLVELYVRWRGVFPHNLLAYNFALFVIIVVGLIASIYNYQRYFLAWAYAPETHAAHNVELNAAARHMLFNADIRYLVAGNRDDEAIVEYLTDGKVEYEYVDQPRLPGVELEAGERLLVPSALEAGALGNGRFACEEHKSSERVDLVLFLECHLDE